MVVVLDRLRSAHNVGNVFRLVEAVRGEGIVTCGYTATPPHAKLAKTARGCDELVHCEHVETGADAVRTLRDAGHRVYAVETVEGAESVWDTQFEFPCALVLGNEALGVSPIPAALHILRLGKSRVVSFNMNPEDISNFMQQPWAMTSSDGTDGHPRKYASFPKKYRDSVVEQKLLSMQAFVHRSSGLTADTFGVKNRGYLRSGYFADIAVLDPNEFGPQADYLHWNSLSTGVKYLLVNGVPAIVEGEYNGALAGRPLRKNQP